MPERVRKIFGGIRQELDRLTSVQVSLTLITFMAFMVIPLLVVVYFAFFLDGRPSVYWFNLIFRDSFYLPFVFELSQSFPYLKLGWGISGQLVQIAGDTVYITGPDFGVVANSLLVALFTTLLSTIVGVTFAFIMARYAFPGKDILRPLLLVPLLSTPFVGAIGILRMIGRAGSLNNLFYEMLGLLPYRIVFDGLAAVVIVQFLHFYSLVYLTTFSALVNIDPTLEEQAENLGSSGFRLFRTVTFPLALPGIEAGAILTFILSIEDLGTPIVFQHSLARKTLVYQIFTRVFSPTGELDPIAPALSVILLMLALVGFLAIRRYVSLRSYAMISKGGVWQPRLTRPTGLKRLLIYAFSVTILALSMIPHVGVVLLSLAKTWPDTILPTAFTWENYEALIENPAISASIGNSVFYSGLAVIFIAVLGTSAAYVVARKKLPGIEAFDSLVTMPIAIPGIVLAIGYFTLFLGTPLSPILNPVPLLIVSYAVRKFPFTVRAAFAGLQQTHVNLEEVSLNLGASRSATFLRITMPLIAVNILAGCMLSFVYAMSEVSTSIVLGGVNPNSAPVTWKIMDVLAQVGAGPFQAAALGVLLMVTQIVIMTTVSVILKQRTATLAGI
jgi:ABC-type Fe3+ transport system permease subunit